MSEKENKVTNVKRKAAERIESLENAFVTLFQDFTKLQQDLQMVNAGVLLLNEKLQALQNLSRVPDEALNEAIESTREENMKTNLKNMIENGTLVAADEVGPESLVVGRVLSEDSKVLNRRFQHYANTFEEDVQKQVLGAKPGQVIDRASNKTKVEVMEVYNIDMEALAKITAGQQSQPAQQA